MLLTYLLRNFHLALGFAGSLLWPPEKAGHRQQELRANVTGQVSRGGPPEWRKGEDTLAEKPVLSLNSKHLLTPSIADGLAGLPHYFLCTQLLCGAGAGLSATLPSPLAFSSCLWNLTRMINGPAVRNYFEDENN
jgi:hypothetical protein